MTGSLRIYSGDAQVWMNIATELYQRNLVYPIRLDESPRANEINVANVCVGFAFELAYKALFEISEETPPKPTHRLRDAHEKLDKRIQNEVERIIAKHGWKDVDSFLNHFDEELRHEERRYWMRPRPPKTGHAKICFWGGYPAGIDVLAKLHKELLDFSENLIDRDTGPDTARQS